MFGELPKLFDRNFAIGYFPPSVIFLAATLGLITRFDLLPNWLLSLVQFNITGTTIFGLASWFGGVLLLGTNRSMLRLMEGYGRFNPARLLGWIERRRYARLHGDIAKLDEAYKCYISNKQEVPQELQIRRAQLMRKAAERFPDEVSWLLPTAFGNTIRAFEVYPRVIYGLDAIPGWIRLLAVIPKEYRELVDTTKAQTDFWLNFWLLSLLIIFEYIGVATYTRELKMLWLPLGALGMAWVASHRARRAAVQWGEWVKASFDVFLPELRAKLGFSSSITRDQELKLWKGFSQAIIYRSPSSMAIRAKSQLKEDNIKLS